MNTKIRRGRITKRLILVEGHNVVYCRHSLEGFAGKMPLGHHATLALPTEDGSAQIATSPIRFAMTCPSPTGIPAEGSYYTLALGKRFKDLAGAPLIWADTKTGDCSALPARKGFTDVLAVFNKPSAAPAWTTATFENRRYMWFSLKDPAVLPSTVMWISNCGRHGAPWNGRNRCLGLEDVCAYFAEGLKASVQPNEISKAGIPTAIRLSPRRPTAINYIQGVTKIPRGFKKVQDAVFRPGEVTFTSTTAKTVTVKVDHEFLKSGEVC